MHTRKKVQFAWKCKQRMAQSNLIFPEADDLAFLGYWWVNMAKNWPYIQQERMYISAMWEKHHRYIWFLSAKKRVTCPRHLFTVAAVSFLNGNTISDASSVSLLLKSKSDEWDDRYLLEFRHFLQFFFTIDQKYVILELGKIPHFLV